MLSTKDNPWNPFTSFDEWLAYDLLHGHDCSGYLMRIADVPIDASEQEECDVIEDAIRRIVALEPDIYIRVPNPEAEV